MKIWLWDSHEFIWRHQKPPKCFFPIASHLNELGTAPCMVSLCWGHQDASYDIHLDLEVMLRSHDVRSSDDLDRMRSLYTYSDVYQWEELDGAVSVALARLVQKLLSKKLPCSQVPPFWLVFPLTSFLTWPENEINKNCISRPRVSNAVYRLSLTCFVFEVSRRRLSAPQRPYQSIRLFDTRSPSPRHLGDWGTVASTWTHQRCFHRSSMFLSNLITESCWRPVMTWDHLGDIRRGFSQGTCCNFLIQCVNFNLERSQKLQFTSDFKIIYLVL